MELNQWITTQLGQDIWTKKYKFENENLDEWFERVSGRDAELKQLIIEKKFLFGGRALTNRNTDNKGSMFNCFTAGHKVITKRGLVNIEDVAVGDYVITEDNSWQRVNNTMKREYKGDLYEIDLYNAYDKITCTANHQFLTDDGWTRADRLVAMNADKHRYRVAHYIKIPTIKFEPIEYTVKLSNYFDETNNNKIEYLENNKIRTVTYYTGGNGANQIKFGSQVNNEIIINEDVKYLFGRWIGDGSVTKIRQQKKHSVFQIVFNLSKEKSACERCKNILIKNFGASPTVIENKKQTTMILRVSNHILANFFYKYFGEKCDGKSIPQELIGSYSLLLGILDSDGGVSKTGSVRLVLKNQRLLEQVKETMYLNGINTTPIRPALTVLREKHYSGYSLFCGNSLAQTKITPYLSKEYDDNRLQLKYFKPLFNLKIDNDIYTQVRSIKIIENQHIMVYNVSVENKHSYTVNGVVVHNCYSIGYAPDDYEGLLELNKNLGLTYKAQGGQGVSMSKLRPKGTPIGKRFYSDGIVPFMEIFNSTTKETSQGGSRKGALMISLDIRHKEAEAFIKIKSQEGKIEKANLSLEIDDEFMQAVDTYYKTGEVITLHEKREYSGHVVEYDVIPIELYKLLVQNCYDWADPACLFTNRFRNYNLMELDDEYQIETSNPCGR